MNTKQGNSCVIRFGHNDVIKRQKGMRCQWLIIHDAQWTFWIVWKFSYFQELHEKFQRNLFIASSILPISWKMYYLCSTVKNLKYTNWACQTHLMEMIKYFDKKKLLIISARYNMHTIYAHDERYMVWPLTFDTWWDELSSQLAGIALDL